MSAGQRREKEKRIGIFVPLDDDDDDINGRSS
jgi:hypothetical protein